MRLLIGRRIFRVLPTATLARTTAPGYNSENLLRFKQIILSLHVKQT